MPPLTISQNAIGPEHIDEVLKAFGASTPEAKHPLLLALAQHDPAERLEAFSWSLLERSLEILRAVDTDIDALELYVLA